MSSHLRAHHLISSHHTFIILRAVRQSVSACFVHFSLSHNGTDPFIFVGFEPFLAKLQHSKLMLVVGGISKNNGRVLTSKSCERDFTKV